jgi:hypothetical protein
MPIWFAHFMGSAILVTASVFSGPALLAKEDDASTDWIGCSD